MLVITRKAQESIIGFDENDEEVIRITAVEVDRNQVRIGISTPEGKKQLKFLREEIVDD